VIRDSRRCSRNIPARSRWPQQAELRRDQHLIAARPRQRLPQPATTAASSRSSPSTSTLGSIPIRTTSRRCTQSWMIGIARTTSIVWRRSHNLINRRQAAGIHPISLARLWGGVRPYGCYRPRPATDTFIRVARQRPLRGHSDVHLTGKGVAAANWCWS